MRRNLPLKQIGESQSRDTERNHQSQETGTDNCQCQEGTISLGKTVQGEEEMGADCSGLYRP